MPVGMVVVCRRVMRVHILAGVHVVMTMLGNRDGADRHRFPRAQHGSSYRTPDREQDSKQNQDEGAQVLHSR